MPYTDDLLAFLDHINLEEFIELKGSKPKPCVFSLGGKLPKERLPNAPGVRVVYNETREIDGVTVSGRIAYAIPGKGTSWLRTGKYCKCFCYTPCGSKHEIAMKIEE